MCSRNESIFVLVSDFMLVGKNFFNSDRKSFSKNIQYFISYIYFNVIAIV